MGLPNTHRTKVVKHVRLALYTLGASLLVLVATGCQTGGAADSQGKTFYLDGAGNWGYGGTDSTSWLVRA